MRAKRRRERQRSDKVPTLSADKSTERSVDGRKLMLSCHPGVSAGLGGVCDLHREFVLDSSEQKPAGLRHTVPPTVYTCDKNPRSRGNNLLLSARYIQTG